MNHKEDQAIVVTEGPDTTDVRPISKTVSYDSSNQFTVGETVFSKMEQVSTPARAQLKPEKVYISLCSWPRTSKTFLIFKDTSSVVSL